MLCKRVVHSKGSFTIEGSSFRVPGVLRGSPFLTLFFFDLFMLNPSEAPGLRRIVYIIYSLLFRSTDTRLFYHVR